MKLSYLTPLTFPSKYVNRLQVMKMSAAFAKAADFALFIAKTGVSKNELFSTYNVVAFPVEEVGEPAFRPRRFWQARKFLPVLERAPFDTMWYARDVLLADWLSTMSKKFRARYFFELHTLSRFSARRYRRVLSRARGIITTNEQKKKDIARAYGLPAEKILVAPNGVDAEEFRALKHKKNEMRRKLGLDADASIVVYAGTDAKEYGTHILREAREMVKTSMRILIISGKPRNEALKYMAAADVLVAPYMAANEHFEKYMSPMKIREYMAMERPIVTTDLPSIRAMIPGDAAFFVPPGSAKSLASVLLEIFTSRKTDARKCAERASFLTDQYSWDARANAISAFIQKNI